MIKKSPVLSALKQKKKGNKKREKFTEKNHNEGAIYDFKS